MKETLLTPIETEDCVLWVDEKADKNCNDLVYVDEQIFVIQEFNLFTGIARSISGVPFILGAAKKLYAFTPKSDKIIEGLPQVLMEVNDELKVAAFDYALEEANRYLEQHPFPNEVLLPQRINLIDIFKKQAYKNFVSGYTKAREQYGYTEKNMRSMAVHAINKANSRNRGDKFDIMEIVSDFLQSLTKRYFKPIMEPVIQFNDPHSAIGGVYGTGKFQFKNITKNNTIFLCGEFVNTK